MFIFSSGFCIGTVGVGAGWQSGTPGLSPGVVTPPALEAPPVSAPMPAADRATPPPRVARGAGLDEGAPDRGQAGPPIWTCPTAPAPRPWVSSVTPPGRALHPFPKGGGGIQPHPRKQPPETGRNLLKIGLTGGCSLQYRARNQIITKMVKSID